MNNYQKACLKIENCRRNNLGNSCCCAFGPTGPTGAKGEIGPTGPSPLYVEETAPENTSLLWINKNDGIMHYYSNSESMWKPITYTWS